MQIPVPFRYGSPLSPEDAHIPRPVIEARIRQNAIQPGGRLALLGPRRIGKSSLAPLALGQTPPLPYLALDLRRLAGPADFCIRASRALRAFRQDAESWKFIVRDRWAAFVGAIEKITLSPVPSLTLAPARGADDLAGVHHVLDTLDLLGRCVPHVTVFFDEFQDVARFEPPALSRALIGILRAAIQHHKHTAYIFAGSHRQEMYRLFFSHSAAFYHSAMLCEVGYFTAEESITFLREQCARGDRTLDRDTAALLLSVAGDVPNDIQLLAFHVWNQSAPGAAITTLTVQTALRQLLDDHEQRLALLLTYTSPIQERVLYALAAVHGGSARFQTSEFAATAGARSRQAIRVAVEVLSRDEGETDDPALVFEEGIAAFRDRWIFLGLLRRVLRNPALLNLRGIHGTPKAAPWLAGLLS
jgi:hypothetical protein